MKTRELASIRLAQNLKKIVRLALINYNKQSAFYRKCNTPESHVRRVIQHYFLGFYLEIQVEQLKEVALNTLNSTITQEQPSLVLQY